MLDSHRRIGGQLRDDLSGLALLPTEPLKPLSETRSPVDCHLYLQVYMLYRNLRQCIVFSADIRAFLILRVSKVWSALLSLDFVIERI